MTHRGPFQPLTFCDSLWLVWQGQCKGWELHLQLCTHSEEPSESSALWPSDVTLGTSGVILDSWPQLWQGCWQCAAPTRVDQRAWILMPQVDWVTRQGTQSPGDWADLLIPAMEQPFRRSLLASPSFWLGKLHGPHHKDPVEPCSNWDQAYTKRVCVLEKNPYSAPWEGVGRERLQEINWNQTGSQGC